MGGRERETEREKERQCVSASFHIYEHCMPVTHLKTPTHPYRCDEVESQRNLQRVEFLLREKGVRMRMIVNLNSNFLGGIN